MVDSSIVQKLTEELNFNLNAKNLKPVSLNAIYEILTVLDQLGYLVLPVVNIIDSLSVEQFNDTVIRWCSREGIESDEINGAQVIDSLRSSGWQIFPPR